MPREGGKALPVQIRYLRSLMNLMAEDVI